MAKVKGPLMSMGATGQLGKSLVFMTWKGIKDVRTHVIPANPKTAGQVAQRGVMSLAVTAWHNSAFNALDLVAINILAAISAKIMSGFNVFCKLFIDNTLLVHTIQIPAAMVISGNTGGAVGISFSLAGTTGGKVRWGHSPSVLGNNMALTHGGAGTAYTAAIPSLTVGQYVYFQVYTEIAPYVWISGIYKVMVLA